MASYYRHRKMESCAECENSQDPGSEYCWFHGLKFIEICWIDKIRNYKKKQLILIPDLLTIVFEYMGYENFLIINFVSNRYSDI